MAGEKDSHCNQYRRVEVGFCSSALRNGQLKYGYEDEEVDEESTNPISREDVESDMKRRRGRERYIYKKEDVIVDSR